MDKYDKLFADIKSRTESGKLCWEIASPENYANYVFNSQNVFRTYKCKYDLSDESFYNLVLVERKERLLDDYDNEYDKYDVCILFLKEDLLVFTLTSGLVDKRLLFGLAEYIEEHSAEAKELFSFFKTDDDES